MPDIRHVHAAAQTPHSIATLVFILLLVVTACSSQPGPMPEPSPTVAPTRSASASSVPLTDEQEGLCGMAVDFLGAVLGQNEAKARSYLVAGDGRGVAELRQAAQITDTPTGWTSRACGFSGDTGYYEAELKVPDRQQAVRILLIRKGDEWRVAGIEPAPPS